VVEFWDLKPKAAVSKLAIPAKLNILKVSGFPVRRK